MRLIVPKEGDWPLSPETMKELGQNKLSGISTCERIFIDVVWLFIFILLSAWIYCLYLSYKAPETSVLFFRAYLEIGFISYFVGVAFSEVKELV